MSSPTCFSKVWGAIPGQSAATNDSFMLRPSTLSKGDIMTIDRPYVDYEIFQQLTERGVIYVTKLKKNLEYTVLEYVMCQTQTNLPSDQRHGV